MRQFKITCLAVGTFILSCKVFGSSRESLPLNLKSTVTPPTNFTATGFLLPGLISTILPSPYTGWTTGVPIKNYLSFLFKYFIIL